MARMKRYQRGYLYEANDAFHVRYLITETDGTRKQRSTKLCDKNKDHASVRSRAVEKLRDDFMRAINAEQTTEKCAVTVVGFYDATYLPWAESQLKPSSLHSLKQIWSQHLKQHFADVAIDAYKTPTASRFLTALAAKYSRNTVAHVRSTMSGIFTHAVNHGLATTNPLRECRVLTKARAPQVTPHYSLDEIENVVNALADEPELQLLVTLAAFAGLRPGEITALKFSDFSDDFVHVRRAVSRTTVTTPKTESSVRSVPLVAPVKMALEAWRSSCGTTDEGWVFAGRFGQRRPGSIVARVRRIKEICAEKNVKFTTLYAGRRAAATLLTQLTGDPLASAMLLGHATIAVTMNAYIKNDRRLLTQGMKLLDAKLNEK